MWIVMPTASLKAKYLSQKLLLMKKSEECFIGNCIYPAKLFIKNLFAKGSTLPLYQQNIDRIIANLGNSIFNRKGLVIVGRHDLNFPFT